MRKADHIPLQPFEGRCAAGIGITCAVDRCGGALGLTYTLRGDLGKVTVPRKAAVSMRKDRLWESTCLECFIADGAGDAYWEFNLSPAGHWNAYRFDAYRQGMCEEKSLSTLPIDIQSQPQALHLSCRIDLAAVGMHQRVLDMGLCAVVQADDGQNSYWALVHNGPRPDFHRRDSFILQVDA